MLKILLLHAVLLCRLLLPAQSTIKISNGTTVKGEGNASLFIVNTNIVNDGALEQTSGTIKFTGTSDVTLGGSGITKIARMQLSLAAGKSLQLQNNLSVKHEVLFTSGLLNLNHAKLDLGATGVLTNEREESRAYGNGFIQAVRTLNNPLQANVGNMGALISSPVNLGSTTVRRGHMVLNSVACSVPSIQRYYDFIPANNSSLDATLRFHYFDAELNGQSESGLQLWTNDGGAWMPTSAGTRDGTSNFLETTQLATLSRITGSGSNPLTVTIPNAKVMDYPWVGANTVYIGYGPASTLTLAGTVSGGSGNYTYQWFVNGAAVIGGSSAKLTITPALPRPYNYQLVVTDNSGSTSSCASIASILVSAKDVRCGNNNDKVYVCHVHEKNLQRNQTICINSSGVDAHLKAGCMLGECIVAPVTAAANPATSNVSSKPLTINVAPNPTTSYFRISIESSNLNVKAQVKVYDVNGRLVGVKNNITINSVIEIGKNFPIGIYLVDVYQNNERKQLTLVKIQN